MSTAIGITFNKEGKMVLTMKAATRDFLLAVLPAAVQDGDVITVDLTDLAVTPEKFAMIDDHPCMIAFARIDDYPCKMDLTPLADMMGVKLKK